MNNLSLSGSLGGKKVAQKKTDVLLTRLNQILQPPCHLVTQTWQSRKKQDVAIILALWLLFCYL